MSLKQRDRELIAAIAETEEDAGELAHAILTAQAPFHVAETVMQEVYQVLGYWYAVSKDRKRRSQGEEKTTWQLREDLLEAWVKGMDRALMTRLHLNKMTERYIS